MLEKQFRRMPVSTMIPHMSRALRLCPDPIGERDAVRLELAQRYRDRGELEQAEAWLLKLAAESDQPGLRARCRNKANDARAEIQRRIQQKSNPPVQGQSDDSPSERGNP
jgi:hypothetical protein